jgi:hypothetical protein
VQPLHKETAGSVVRKLISAMLLTAAACTLGGCKWLRPHAAAEYVYVATRRPVYLRDRVAPVSNHTAQVSNGERLQVLERIHRFVKVQTAQGSVGWIEEAAVLNSAGYAQFQALAAQHAHDPVISRAVTRDDVYMHIAPGTRAEHFYLIPANTRVEVLGRTSIPKPGAPLQQAQSQTTTPHPGQRKHSAAPAVEIPMEDWWLARTASEHTGWILARQLDMDIPEDIAQYAEGKRMMGAYVLRNVSDPDSGKPDGLVPDYVTVLTEYKDGLPYDFDEVRVFTWDTRHHRYGTAYVERNLAGYFPVVVSQQDFTDGPEPVFTIRVAPSQRPGKGSKTAPTPQPAAATTSALETQTYRLQGESVHRVLPPGSAQPAGTQKTKRRSAGQKS